MEGLLDISHLDEIHSGKELGNSQLLRELIALMNIRVHFVKIHKALIVIRLPTYQVVN